MIIAGYLQKNVPANKDNINNYNHRKYILALDDEIDIVSLIKQTLQKHGFKVSAFTDPLAALQRFKRNFKDCNLVISDIRMPAMNGYEFVKKVKETKKDAKVILISAFEINDKEFYNVSQSIKIDAFLQKPFSIKQLNHIVEEHLMIN